jgi:hypothetical protein
MYAKELIRGQRFVADQWPGVVYEITGRPILEDGVVVRIPVRGEPEYLVLFATDVVTIVGQ